MLLLVLTVSVQLSA